MDSLMEALQSGAAFRDRRKRTPRNGNAKYEYAQNQKSLSLQWPVVYM